MLRARLTSAIGRALEDRSRRIFGVLRRVRPLIATNRFGVVTRADDVREVLGDYSHFTVPLYNRKMTEISGPFILGLDDTPLYRRDYAALRAAIRPADIPGLAAATLAAARERVATADGRIDIVVQLVDPAVDRVIAQYFGTPGPDTATQVRWSRDIFQQIFLNVGNSSVSQERALVAAAEMRPHLDAQIAARRDALAAGEEVPDDVLTRLLRDRLEAGGLHDIAIRHNLIGLIAGWIPTVSKAFARAVDELLDRPAELERVQQAARTGDHELVGRYVFEALRFRPQTWALLRSCAADCTVAAGTPRATRFRAGSTVLIATQSAMFDEHAFPAPNEFRIDRDFDHYLHFGHGLHTCFGREINRVHLPALAVALFEGPRVQRTPNKAGQMSWDGPYPASLTVSFGSDRTG
ncbi:MAG: cytochrome P450 [Solirubrobacterales bacterium]|nr:cytochrome P450 [Solirubrobacterales bacterium]